MFYCSAITVSSYAFWQLKLNVDYLFYEAYRKLLKFRSSAFKNFFIFVFSLVFRILTCVFHSSLFHVHVRDEHFTLTESPVANHD